MRRVAATTIGAVFIALASVPTGVSALAGSASAGTPVYASDARFTSTSILVKGSGPTPEKISESELVDATATSKATGEPLPSLLARTSGMSEFSLAMTEFEAKYPDLVTRWGLPAAGEAGPNWVIAPTAGEEALRMALDHLGTDTEIRLGAPAGMRSTEAEIAAAMSSLLKSGTTQYLSSGYDLDRFHAVVEFKPSDGVSDERISKSLEEARAAARDARGSGYVDGEIQFVQDEALARAVSTTTVQGGRLLTLQSTGGGECTAGFAADRSTNEGLITAQHCTNNLNYRTLSGIITFGSNADSLPNALIDLQFHRATAGNDAGHNFYATGTTTADDRPVTSIANSGINAPVCKWGAYGGFGCGSVVLQAQCFTYGANVNLFCGEDVSTPTNLVGGDSGGPWFYGNQARGFAAARLEDPVTQVEQYDAFVRVGRAAESLHATIHEQ